MNQPKRIDYSNLYDATARLNERLNETPIASFGDAKNASDVILLLEAVAVFRKERSLARTELHKLIAGLGDRRAPAVLAKQLRQAEKTIRKQAAKIKSLNFSLKAANACIPDCPELTALGRLRRAEGLLTLTRDAIVLERRASILRGIIARVQDSDTPSNPPAPAESHAE